MTRPDVTRILGGLKDFQRATVEYAFGRMYTDPDPTRRFLVADEVGLGKTLVAKGIVAKAIDRLWKDVARIDIVYICSNTEIARQNIARLRIGEEVKLATRITLLPAQIETLQRKLNFVALTPGTSFDLRSSMGITQERVLLYHLLKDEWGFSGTREKNVLRGNASSEVFRAQLREFDSEHLNAALRRRFHDTLEREAQRDEEGRHIRERFRDLAKDFAYDRKHIPSEQHKARTELIARLRAVLAASCLEALEPDLIILDEFQRFKHLLDGQDEASELATRLFTWEEARVLLLSATPYKMYSLDHEIATDDHYADFLRTFHFLRQDQAASTRFEALLSRFRAEIRASSGRSPGRLRELRTSIEDEMRKVMVRTERLAVTPDRDGMLVTRRNPVPAMETDDVRSYVGIQRVAEILDAEDVTEYWKSAPYLLSFMDEYRLKQDFVDACEDRKERSKIAAVLRDHPEVLLDWRRVEGYDAVPTLNARLRTLVEDVIDRGAWKLLWIPPSLPYYEPAPPFDGFGTDGLTKRLVFSAWHVVPKVVAGLLSYAAERRMSLLQDSGMTNTQEARKARRGLLRFAHAEGRLTGMPVLGLMFPSVALADLGDPLMLAARGSEDAPRPFDSLLREVVGSIRSRLEPLLRKSRNTERDDERWYWAAPALLDRLDDPYGLDRWLEQSGASDASWGSDADPEDEGGDTAFTSHVNELRSVVKNWPAVDPPLGPAPDDLCEQLAMFAIAGPGVCALRAVSRAGGDRRIRTLPGVRSAAARIAWDLRNLFNAPEVMSLVRGLDTGRNDKPYWAQVVDYAARGNLQSVLDEYAHVLRESKVLRDEAAESVATRLAREMHTAISLRTSRVGVDDFNDPDNGGLEAPTARNLRSRFAVRFAKSTTADREDSMRPSDVRDSFNSPFWPFVLATTSVGQEGLDFHSYCHRVVHWNLPSNPVDLEQREGRVHRFKGHAVRRNVAGEVGLRPELANGGDPWDTLFEWVASRTEPGGSELVPYWVFAPPGGARIERQILALPLSRDSERAEVLRRSLGVYRMVFGQPRQEDLLAFLLATLGETDLESLAQELRIDLSPPRSSTDH